MNWNTPSGELLDALLDLLPKPPAKPVELTVFGSAVLQMGLAPDLVSADVDVFCTGYEALRALVLQNKLDPKQREPGIEVTAPGWRTAAGWERRAQVVERKGHTLIFPDPLDVLVSKIQRSEPKDLLAFKLTRGITGHPTEEELIAHLRLAIDLYRPTFDEEKASDMVNNTRLLWQDLYGHDIDVREQLIRPVLRQQAENWHQDIPDYRAEAAALVEKLLGSRPE